MRLSSKTRCKMYAFSVRQFGILNEKVRLRLKLLVADNLKCELWCTKLDRLTNANWSILICKDNPSKIKRGGIFGTWGCLLLQLIAANKWNFWVYNPDFIWKSSVSSSQWLERFKGAALGFHENVCDFQENVRGNNSEGNLIRINWRYWCSKNRVNWIKSLWAWL